jgi:nitroimidazol reductase NimA-like FMN-containing flavoprotein (pyridoxamine 5'-phosphate oxidase superfamily)
MRLKKCHSKSRNRKITYNGAYKYATQNENTSLDAEKIQSLLCKGQVATIATINNDGTPYTTPIHFLYQENAIYFHGLPKGQKLTISGQILWFL